MSSSPIDLAKVAGDAVQFRVVPEAFSSKLVAHGLICFGKDVSKVKGAAGQFILRPREVEGFRSMRNVVSWGIISNLPADTVSHEVSSIGTAPGENGYRVVVILHPPEALPSGDTTESDSLCAPRLAQSPLLEGLKAGSDAGSGEEYVLLEPHAVERESAKPRPKGWANDVIRKVSGPLDAAALEALGYSSKTIDLCKPDKASSLGMLAPAVPIRLELQGSYMGMSAQAAIAAFLPVADPQEGLTQEGGREPNSEGSTNKVHGTAAGSATSSLYARSGAAKKGAAPGGAGAGKRALEAEMHRLPPSAASGPALSSSSSSSSPASAAATAAATGAAAPSGAGQAPSSSEGGGAISSFEQAGDVAHVNLVQTHFPWRFAIGRVLLDLQPTLRTVLVKCGTIESVYRTFPMQVVAGIGAREEAIARTAGAPLPPIPVTLRETDCSLSFDFRRVYWNSRLQHEHRHMVEAIVDAGVPGASTPADKAGSSSGAAGPEETKDAPPTAGKKRKRGKHERAVAGRGIIIADACAGVGPFAVPLAKRGATVLANDLNPESHKWLVHNAKSNKCGATLAPSRDDGANFLLRHIAAAQGEDVPPLKLPEGESEGDGSGVASSAASGSTMAGDRVPSSGFDHILVNLPASSVSFVPALQGVFDRAAWPRPALPVLHCYTFAAAPYSRDGTLQQLALLEGGAADAQAPDREADGVLASNRGGGDDSDGAVASGVTSSSAASSVTGRASSSSSSSQMADNDARGPHHTVVERRRMALEDATQRVLHALGLRRLHEQRDRVSWVDSIRQVVQAEQSPADEGGPIPVCGRVIRDVSPNKYMVCISVRVPWDCGSNGKPAAAAPGGVGIADGSGTESASKRARVE